MVINVALNEYSPEGSSYCFEMATDAPTILATSGGYREHDRLRFQFAGLLHYAVDVSGVSARVPKVCNVGTASGDDPRFQMTCPKPVCWLASISPT